jgi:hypothetical protein
MGLLYTGLFKLKQMHSDINNKTFISQRCHTYWPETHLSSKSTKGTCPMKIASTKQKAMCYSVHKVKFCYRCAIGVSYTQPEESTIGVELHVLQAVSKQTAHLQGKEFQISLCH